MPLDGTITIVPNNNQLEEDEAQQDDADDDNGDLYNDLEHGNGVNDDMILNNNDISDDDYANIEPNNDELVDLMENFVISLVQDSPLDLTKDNRNTCVGFFNTNVGDLPLNVESNQSSDAVSGHVIFNQAGQCVSRRNEAIV